MAFFSPEKLQSRQIDIDQTQVSCDSPEVQKRLARIESNYAQLEEILAGLESQMKTDERLKAIDEASASDFEETFGVKRKRKWRTSKKKKAKRSANPKKPR